MCIRDSHKVIIIGAGAAGIASSKVLSDKNIPHLILESRERIGGRIASKQLNGVEVDLGATFVHNPGEGNSIDEMIKEMNWEKVESKMDL